VSARGSAELVITGRIATLSGDDGFGWQRGIAMADGRVIAVGDAADLEPLVGPGTTRWRLTDDMLVVPGITDAHLHLMSLVLAERHVDLTGANLDEALERIGARHREMAAAGDPDGWLLGHGWSLHSFGRWPDAALLESVAPNRPVALYAHDHHTRWVSRRALELAGVDPAFVDPDGGLIRRDADGTPTGILHEVASVLVDPAIPNPSPDELAAGLERVSATLHRLGLTGCHDPGELTSDADIERGPVFYRAIAASGRLPLRVHSSVRAPQLERATELGLSSGQGIEPEPGLDERSARRAERYRMGWLKLFADGSLGSRSAALLAPYTDAGVNPPTGGPTGMVLTDAAELAELLGRAAKAGISGQVHAIGDAAVRTALDVFDASSAVAQRANQPSPLMPRIEHAQLIDPADMPRFGALGIAASVQPVHLRSDADPARAAWGARTANTFPLRALIDGGALIPIGTDAPVEPPDPWPGLAVAVARRDPFHPDDQQTGAHHAITLARALRAACLDPALVAGAEQELGRLMPGYRADLIVVSASAWREPFEPAEFASIRPLATLLDGEVVHRSGEFDPFEG